MKDMTAVLEKAPLIAIARHLPSGQVLAAAHTLREAGFHFIEVTMNSDGALDTISELSEAFRGTDFYIGAGTVLSAAAAEEAIDHGASFLVCPHTDPELIRYSLSRNVLPLPGVMTPSDIVNAQNAGACYLKLFPAGALGPDYVKQIRGPFSDVFFLAVGGIGLSNAPAFLKAGCRGFGLGGSLLNAQSVSPEGLSALKKDAEAWIKLLTDSSRV